MSNHNLSLSSCTFIYFFSLWDSRKTRSWNWVLKKRADYCLRLTLGLGCLHLCCCSSNACSLERTDLDTELNLFFRRRKCKETAIFSNKIKKPHKTCVPTHLSLPCFIFSWNGQPMPVDGILSCSWLFVALERKADFTYMWTRENKFLPFYFTPKIFLKHV